MNITLTLLLALMPSAFPFEQLPAQVDQLKETPVFITDLRKAPTKVVLDGRSLTIAAYLWRDFMPGSVSGPDGSPMMAVFKVATTDKQPFPGGVRIERAWILFGEQVWDAGEFGARNKNRSHDKDLWSWSRLTCVRSLRSKWSEVGTRRLC